jgi:hypothetical protein
MSNARFLQELHSDDLLITLIIIRIQDYFCLDHIMSTISQWMYSQAQWGYQGTKLVTWRPELKFVLGNIQHSKYLQLSSPINSLSVTEKAHTSGWPQSHWSVTILQMWRWLLVNRQLCTSRDCYASMWTLGIYVTWHVQVVDGVDCLQIERSAAHSGLLA